LIATPEVMNNLKALAKTLGPKGLMPNTKVGSLVTPDKLGIFYEREFRHLPFN